MTARICDRCGKDAEGDAKFDFNGKTHDLCWTCFSYLVASVRIWMRSPSMRLEVL